MDIREIKNSLSHDWECVQEVITSVLGSDIDFLNRVNDRILLNMGKQMRPMLALLSARCCGICNSDTHRYAAAGELMHNATLLHDDVADDSDTRRGKPTINALLGSGVSVLLGDYWLVKAVSTILGAENHGDEVMSIFTKTLQDLVEGEMLQLQMSENCQTGEEEYLRIIYSKTASLFEAVAVAAAISVSAPGEYKEALRTFAVNLGLAFQIRDDIFDYSPDMNTGKPAGADILEKKITMPLLGAFRNAGKEKEEEIRQKIREIDSTNDCSEEICAFVRDNDGIAYAQNRLEKFIEEALLALNILPDTEAKMQLASLVKYVGNRVL